MKAMALLLLLLMLCGCEFSDSGPASTTTVPSEESEEPSDQPAEEGERFTWVLTVAVYDQGHRPLVGAYVTVQIVGATQQYAVSGYTDTRGYAEFLEKVYPNWIAIVTASKPGYVSLTETIKVDRTWVYFYLPSQASGESD